MSARILLLEDDPAIAQTVAFVLEREGYRLALCGWLHEARACLARAETDLALLDVGLPDVNGLDLCREIRQGPQPALPILMLSARSEESARYSCVSSRGRGSSTRRPKSGSTERTASTMRRMTASCSTGTSIMRQSRW